LLAASVRDPGWKTWGEKKEVNQEKQGKGGLKWVKVALARLQGSLE